jgi:fructokinase
VSTLIGAIEAGGTKFVCAVADEHAKVIAETRIATTSPDATLREVATFFAAVSGSRGSFAAIGIGTFGPVDLRASSSSYGQLLATPKLGWAGTDLVGAFAERFDCPIAIDTDVNAAALAETLYGAARGCGTVVYVTVGTGIGGGGVANGRTLRGALHPEMGHLRVARHALDATFGGVCAFHGDCLEGLASGAAIVARYGAPLHDLPPEHEARRVVGNYLGQLAASTVLMLSPERLIFGGGVAHDGALLPEIRAVAAKLLNGYPDPSARPAALEAVIVAPVLGERSGIIGAIELARRATLPPDRDPTTLPAVTWGSAR